MRAVACQHGELDLVERPEPEPGPGQVRIEVMRCGICGSDLHARTGIDHWAELATRVGYRRFGRSEQPIVFGHEFSGRVAEYGPGCRGQVPSGAPVVALPAAPRRRRRRPNRALAGSARRLRRADPGPGVADDGGAERPRPRRRGAHRADGGRPARGAPRRGRKAGRRRRDRLRPGRPRGDPDAEGDRRAHRRRQRLLPRPAGAGRALRRRRRRRPRGGLALRAAAGQGPRLADELPGAIEMAIGAREKLERLPFGWWHAWRLAERARPRPRSTRSSSSASASRA